MASSIFSAQQQFDHDQVIWSSLKQVIVNSSGFRRWQGEQNILNKQQQDIELQVRRYLEETLETLAY